jgi:hypothetical protein
MHVRKWIERISYSTLSLSVLIRYSTYDRVYEAESPLGVHESLWSQLGELTNTMPKPLAGPRRPAVPTPGEI